MTQLDEARVTKVNKSYKNILDELTERYLREEITIEEYTKAVKELRNVGKTLESTVPGGPSKGLLLG